jgi:curved DNA-binding protein CbpA
VKIGAIGHWLALMIAPLLLNCGGSSGHAPVAGAGASSTESLSKEAPKDSPKRVNVSAESRSGLSLDGEHFTMRTVIDRQQGGMPLAVFVAPEHWVDRSEVIWNYANTSVPVHASVSAENPADAQAFYLFPSLDLFWLLPAGYYRPGQNYLGQVYAEPMRPEVLLATFAEQMRGRQAGFRLIGSKSLPGLAAALDLPPSKAQQGVGVKVRYERDGKPIEEEFYAVYYRLNIPYDGPQGRTWQTNWGLMAPHSFRAPAGMLDRRREVFTAISRSIRRNPAWQARLAAINQYLTEQFNRQLQAGYDQIAAAGRLSQQISANNDAMLASIDSRLQASRTSTNAAAAARSSADKFDDYIRGVETTDDPYYGTSQHANTESYHWTDGYGSYRNTNDASANPNQTENGNWTLMQPTR